MTLVHVDLRRPDVTTDEPSEGMIELAPYRRVSAAAAGIVEFVRAHT